MGGGYFLVGITLAFIIIMNHEHQIYMLPSMKIMNEVFFYCKGRVELYISSRRENIIKKTPEVVYQGEM